MINIHSHVPIIGIYKITSPSGRIYIGQSINIEKRFNSYYRLYCKTQPRLYLSLKKYGVDKHIFEIIEECLEKEINERERYWQDYYKVCSKGGLNCKLTKTNDKFGKLSEESCIKKSKSTKGKPKPNGFGEKISKSKIGKPSPKYKPIFQYDLEMNLINEWDSQSSVMKKLKIHPGKALRKKEKTAGGFKWEYKIINK